MAFPTIGSLSKTTPFSLLYHLYHFYTIDQRHPIYKNVTLSVVVPGRETVLLTLKEEQR
jgi:hypothetical protein